jgi:hypothetical protein
MHDLAGTVAKDDEVPPGLPQMPTITSPTCHFKLPEVSG